jgi:hypothetical protein
MQNSNIIITIVKIALYKLDTSNDSNSMNFK